MVFHIVNDCYDGTRAISCPYGRIETVEGGDEGTELKREVSAVHERTTRELAQKITKSSYQFKKKAHEIQFTFNSGIEESVTAAKNELSKIASTDDQDKEAIKKAEMLLDEGLKSLEKRQKHIKVADRSEFGWATVEHYDSHPLAADSDDEKRLEKAEKEAERAANKRRRGSGTGIKKKNLFEGAGPSSRMREPPVAIPPPLLPQGPTRPPRVPVLGPCFYCGQFGHLARMCPKKSVYPFNQPVVGKAEIHVSTVCPGKGCGQTAVLKGSTSEVEVKQCVNKCKVFEANDIDTATSEVEIKQCVNKCKAFEGNDIDTATSEVEDKQWVNKCEAFKGYDIDSVDDFTNPDEPIWESDLKFWEVETDSLPSQITDVQGRLRKNLKFWQEVLKAPDTVLEYIVNGYHLPFKFLPPSHNQCNNKSTETHQQFVNEAVHSLLANRCIRRVEAEPWVCSPLSVVSNSMGKLRLVLNLRYVNQFLHVTKFKYEDLRVAALMFERNEYMFKFDLKSGYYHVDIHCEHQKYLGFRWDTEGCPQFYVFTVLPFGLSTACYVFTKLLRPMIRRW